jgi:hypothetical protein
MKHLIFTCTFSFLLLSSLNGQDNVMMKKDMVINTDSTKSCCADCYTNLVSAGGKYYFNTLKNTRTTLSQNGFILDQEAFEYQIRLYNLPKVFYYQQLGTLTNTNYVSVTGFGLKEDIRFNIFKSSNFILAPYMELGGGYYRMNIAKGITSNTISSVLGSEVENYFLDNFVLSGDVGLDLGFGFAIDNNRLSIVFNGGYISNVPTEWRMAGSLAFKEKVNLSSPYAGVTVRLEMNCTSCNDKNCCK